MEDITIKVVVENSVSRRKYLSEHGLSFFIAAKGKKILFDCGQGSAFYANLYPMGIYVSLIDFIAFSHGHYDHTGGVEYVLGRNKKVLIYAHPSALLPRFRNEKGAVRDVGMPEYCRNAILKNKDMFKKVIKPTEICDAVFLTGEIPRKHDEEKMTEESFCSDSKGEIVDDIPDDQALYMKTHSGTIVLLRCAHSGLINTLDYIHELTNGKPFRAVIGGTHLRSASKKRIRWTLDELKRFEIGMIAPAHCTGIAATNAIMNAYPESFENCETGSVFTF